MFVLWIWPLKIVVIQFDNFVNHFWCVCSKQGRLKAEPPLPLSTVMCLERKTSAGDAAAAAATSMHWMRRNVINHTLYSYFGLKIYIWLSTLAMWRKKHLHRQKFAKSVTLMAWFVTFFVTSLLFCCLPLSLSLSLSPSGGGGGGFVDVVSVSNAGLAISPPTLDNHQTR